MRLNEAIDKTIKLSKWMEKNNLFGKRDIKKFKIYWEELFVFYMNRFARQVYYHDFVDNEDYGSKNLLTNWKIMTSELMYCSDRMNFGRLVKLSRIASHIIGDKK
jgi:hypothetical protein